jgi:hypothetical protein
VPVIFARSTNTLLDYTWDLGLAPDTTYTYAVFARNYAANHSTATTVTVTTPA